LCGAECAELEGELQKLRGQAATKETRLEVAESRGRELEATLGGALEEVETRKAEQRSVEETHANLGSQFQALKVGFLGPHL